MWRWAGLREIGIAKSVNSAILVLVFVAGVVVNEASNGADNGILVGFGHL